jgi:hypothetical protein
LKKAREAALNLLPHLSDYTKFSHRPLPMTSSPGGARRTRS